MSMPTNIIYLESYVEGTASLPPELQRMLNLIKALDERCEDLMDTLARNVERCNQLPPQGIRKAPTDYPPEYTALVTAISSDQTMLKQLAEEKVQIAHQALDLLDLHSTDLNRMLEAFEAEYTTANPAPSPLDASDAFGAMDGGGGGGGFGGGGSSKRPKAEPWENSMDLGALPGMPAVKRGGHKGRREDTQKRKASLAASQYTQEEFEVVPEVVPERRLMNPIPPGMRSSSSALQRPGHTLQYMDISQALRGRLAEVWWPDDNTWYLIEIQDVNVHDLTADIMYVTGETEILELKEIVKDQHMSLIDV